MTIHESLNQNVSLKKIDANYEKVRKTVLVNTGSLL